MHIAGFARFLALTAVVASGLACVPAALAQDAPPAGTPPTAIPPAAATPPGVATLSAAPAPKVVHLNGASALAKLAKTNPDHAARAERILAAATELCKPGPETVNYASFQADDIRCDGAILRTSNPAKREISFKLDDTRYLALVTVTDPAPRLLRVPDPEQRYRGAPSR
jgi:hypothetical protein